MTEVVLLTGGNLGPVAETLSRARQMLIERVGPEKICSGVWESEPWGFEAPQRFLNQVLVLETALEPLAVLDTVQEIERMLGRIREVVPNTITGPEIATSSAENSGQAPRDYHSRPIDIDILFYGDRIIDLPRLNVPHPLIAQRAFVLHPLCEILPEYRHPITGLSVREMLVRIEPGDNGSR